MTRLSALLLAFALGATSALALVACGSGDDADLLPGTTAEEIESNLEQVEQLAADGDCFGAEDAVAQVTAEVEGLEGVDVRLKRALEDGTARLSEVVGRCEEESSEEETEPSVETDVEPEEVEEEKEKKPKEKPDKEKEPAEEEPSEGEGPELPPQANGKGEEKGGGPPPAESEPEETAPSGGVGPNVGVE